MKKEELTQLSDEDLKAEVKRAKSGKWFDAVFFGVLVGVAVYSTFKNGLGLLTFLPLAYLPMAGKNKMHRAAVQEVARDRGLQVD
ncbi:MAG: FUSC family protein [Flavobacteriales bacterium]|nr:FUSC family protein [Flavobacteriales bacterium]